jgi:hypothetical protein
MKGLALHFDVDHFPTLVMAAVGAYTMGQAGFATVGANDNVARLERIMRPAAVTSARGNTSFWKRGHLTLLKFLANYALFQPSQKIIPVSSGSVKGNLMLPAGTEGRHFF